MTDRTSIPTTISTAVAALVTFLLTSPAVWQVAGLTAVVVGVGRVWSWDAALIAAGVIGVAVGVALEVQRKKPT